MNKLMKLMKILYYLFKIKLFFCYQKYIFYGKLKMVENDLKKMKFHINTKKNIKKLVCFLRKERIIKLIFKNLF